MFRKAERKKAKLRLCLCGTSGSGKTYGALQLAQGLGKKIVMIDTENKSGDLYAHLCDFDIATLEAPYSPDKYIELIKGAEKAGYDVLIIDSLTHAWTGEGGVLDMKDQATKAIKGNNSFTAWREVTPKHNALVDAILQSPLHVITSMRTKTAYEIVENDRGKKAPVKIGLAPIQRDGMEYEFTVVLDLSIDGHIATSSKDRTGLFDGKHMMLKPDTGKMLLDWLETGVEPSKPITLTELLKKIKETKALAHLQNLWEKHKQVVINKFNPEDTETATKAKDAQKDLLIKQKSEHKEDDPPGCTKNPAECEPSVTLNDDSIHCKALTGEPVCPHVKEEAKAEEKK